MTGSVTDVEAVSGRVVHNLNNLLGVVIGRAGIAATLCDDDEICEDLQQIELAARKAASLTAQLRSFLDGRSSEARLVDVSGAIHEIDQLVVLQAKPAAEVAFDLCRTLPPVSASPADLHSVVLCLVEAAVRGAGVGQTVTVRTRADDPAAPARVAIEVLPTGNAGSDLAGELASAVQELRAELATEHTSDGTQASTVWIPVAGAGQLG